MGCEEHILSFRCGWCDAAVLFTPKSRWFVLQRARLNMARRVKCVCGRKFYIGHSNSNVQCRNCGRWWSGRELSGVGAVATVLLGGEIAGTQKQVGDRKTSKKNSHKKKQTNRKRPSSNPIGSVLRCFFG